MKPSKVRRIEKRRAARESEVALVARALASRSLREAGEVSGVIAPAGAPEGTCFDVILITEGLGNRRDMNFYSAEAIVSAPDVFEGKPCFLNHPSASDEMDIPERRVEDKCGYFKNCRAVDLREGMKALRAELHFDLSESGKIAADKARTALHYRKEFPASSEEYIGLSVNADGITEDRVMTVEGERVEVNYVSAFSAATSCDLVTTPARGGRILALLESAGGSRQLARVVMSLESLKGPALKRKKKVDAAEAMASGQMAALLRADKTISRAG